jgi:hypothetical protein
MSNEYKNRLQLKGPLTAQDDIKDFLIQFQGWASDGVRVEIDRTEDSYQMVMGFSSNGTWFSGIYLQIERHMKTHLIGPRAIEAYATFTCESDGWQSFNQWMFDGDKCQVIEPETEDEREENVEDPEVIETGCIDEFSKKMALDVRCRTLNDMVRDIERKQFQLKFQHDALSAAMDSLKEQGAEPLEKIPFSFT